MILRKPPSDWDERVDVVVVGSGGAGSTAALKARADGAETLVFEKSPKIGGTTAISGGGLWILDHELVVEEVGETDRETLESYIRRNVGDRVPGDLIDAFLDTSVEAVDFIEDETGLEFRFAVHPEYHLDMAGAKPKGRMIEPALFDARYRRQYPVTVWKIGPDDPDPDPDWAVRAESLRELADMIDVDPDTLVGTMETVNEHARKHEDPDYQRGESVYDRTFGDSRAEHPNLGPVDEPPFYAIRVYPGALGTKGGQQRPDPWPQSNHPYPYF